MVLITINYAFNVHCYAALQALIAELQKIVSNLGAISCGSRQVAETSQLRTETPTRKPLKAFSDNNLTPSSNNKETSPLAANNKQTTPSFPSTPRSVPCKSVAERSDKNTAATDEVCVNYMQLVMYICVKE